MAFQVSSSSAGQPTTTLLVSHVHPTIGANSGLKHVIIITIIIIIIVVQICT